MSAALLGLLLPLAGAAQTCSTTITGKVYSPNGTDPLPNILVYVPTTAVQPFPAGVSSCLTQSQLVSGNPLVSTTTAPDGSFSLTNVGLAGTQTLVIQAGKWRRVYTNAVTATACTTATAPNLVMPQNQTQGDIPEIAISTGSADALECVFRKIGISDSEFTAPGGGGRINLYAGSQATGLVSDASGTALPSETVLMSNSSTLNGYDIAMFACQGTATNPAAASANNQANLVNYADVGGRVFATHYSYVWLDNNGPFAGTANWLGGTENRVPTASGNGTATIDQTYAEGKVLATWLQDIGATTTQGQLPLQSVKQDQTGVISPTQSWATLNQPYSSYGGGAPIMQFTFDTPVNATTTPTIGVTFNNTPSFYTPGDAADLVTINVTDNSQAAADSTLNLTLSIPTGLTVTGLAGANAGTGWMCSVSTLTCNRQPGVGLAAGASDPVALTVSVATNAPHGPAPITVTLGGGGLSGTNQCGRVLFNEYHVEPPVARNSGQFPAECDTTAMTPQEKFLEFSLYNLSNFVAPVTVDNASILGASTTVITGLVSPIYYGQIIGDTAVVQVNGASTGGTIKVYIDSQLVCTLTVTGATMSCPASTGAGYNAGMHTVYAVFSGDSQTQGSTSPTYQVTILPDPTMTMVTSSVNPSHLTQAVTFTATVADAYATATGQVAFLDGTTIIGTGTLSGGVATFTTSSLALGDHAITASYPYSLTSSTNGDFLPSVGALPIQTVLYQLVGDGKPGFTITVTPSPVVVPVYSAVFTTITVTEINGFSEAVNLSCSGMPNEASCLIGGLTIPAGGGTAQMLVSSTSPHACYAANNSAPLPFGPKSGGGIVLAGAFGLFLLRKRRKMFALMLLVVGLCGMTALQGCGSGCTDLGTLPGTYSFTVSGTSTGSAALTRSVSVELDVSVKQ
jgi:hypothetical protein